MEFRLPDLPIAREGLLPVTLAVLAGGVLAVLGLWVLALLALDLAVCIGFVLRNPDRVPPDQSQQPESPLVLAPADGIIASIENASPPEDAKLGAKRMQCVTIRVSVLDVMMLRAPVNAEIIACAWAPGSWRNATGQAQNETMTLALESSKARKYALVQSAGRFGKRTQCTLEPGAQTEAGAVFGALRLGGQIFFYLPTEAKIQLQKGQRLVAGETVLAQYAE